jgi:hypothetical protein
MKNERRFRVTSKIGRADSKTRFSNISFPMLQILFKIKDVSKEGNTC